MIHLDKRGRPANNEELAAIIHEMNPGDQTKIYGDSEEVLRLANSLSRTHKRHRKTRFSCHKNKNGSVVITCVSNRQPTTVILV